LIREFDLGPMLESLKWWKGLTRVYTSEVTTNVYREQERERRIRIYEESGTVWSALDGLRRVAILLERDPITSDRRAESRRRQSLNREKWGCRLKQVVDDR